MSTLFIIVLLISGLVLVVASLFFQIAIFREGGLLWGLASMFIPFASLVCLIKFWDGLKRPFLWTLASGVVFVGAAGGLVATKGADAMSAAATSGSGDDEWNERDGGYDQGSKRGGLPPRRPRRDAAAEPAAPSVDPATSGEVEANASAPLSSSPAGSEEAVQAPPPSPRPEDFMMVPQEAATTIPFARAADYVGQQVEVITTNKRRSLGTILRVEGDRLVIETWVGDGNMVYGLPRDRISEIRLPQ